jgi:hypothetical protein
MITAEYLQDISGFVELEVVTHFELALDTTTVERCDEIGKLMPTLSNLRFIPSVSDQLLPSIVNDESEDETSNVGTVYSNIPRITSLGTKLTNLKVLWISRCQVKDLRGIQFSPALQELYASFNQISSLDPLGALQQTLEICDLEGNNITSIDSVLHNFGNSRDMVSGAMSNSSLLSKRLNRDSGGQSNSSPLRTLTVSGNPFAFQNSQYRIEILRHLPHLQLLDDMDVQPDELSSALCLQNSSLAAPAQQPPIKATPQHFDPQGEASLLYSSLQRNMHDPLKSMMDTQHRDLRSRQTASSAIGGSRAGGPRSTPPQKNSTEPSSTLTQSRAVFRGGLVRSLREAASSQPASACSTPPALEQIVKEQSSNISAPTTPKSDERGFTPTPPRRGDEKSSRPLDEILAHELSVHDPLVNICDDDDDDEPYCSGSVASTTDTVGNKKIVRMPRPQSTLLADGFREMYNKKGVTLIFDGEEEGVSPLPNDGVDVDLDKLFEEVENGPSQTPKSVSPTPSNDNQRSTHLLSSTDILVELQREKAKTAKVVLESALFESTAQHINQRPEGCSPRRKVFRNSDDTPEATGYETISMDDLGDDDGATFDEVM